MNQASDNLSIAPYNLGFDGEYSDLFIESIGNGQAIQIQFTHKASGRRIGIIKFADSDDNLVVVESPVDGDGFHKMEFVPDERISSFIRTQLDRS